MLLKITWLRRACLRPRDPEVRADVGVTSCPGVKPGSQSLLIEG